MTRENKRCRITCAAGGITHYICEECKHDNKTRVLLLNRVDPCKLQLTKK